MDALLARMPSPVLARWMAFYDLCPWGGDVENLRVGKLAATIVNWAGQALKKDAPRATPTDFFPLPTLAPSEPVETPDPLAELDALAEAQNGEA